MKLKLMTGIDIPVPEIQTVVHQPTIREISYMGELDFFQSAQTFCFNKDLLVAQNQKGNSGLDAMTNFQVFMTLITDPKIQDLEQRRNAILSFFTILFPNYIPQFLPKGIYFNNAQTKHYFTMNDNNFDILQSIISAICCVSKDGQSGGGFNPKGKKAAEIAAKLMKGRQRAAESRGESKDSGILSRYVSILTVGLESMSLNDCLNLTIYQLYDLIERYGLYTAWDLDIKSRLAGGKPDSKPDDWMKNIH